jgi:hypothetical protein
MRHLWQATLFARMSMFDDSNRMTETIIRVAIEFTEVTLSLPAPNRHHHVIAHYAAMGGRGSGRRQGFITSKERFVTRTEAAKIAYASGQIAAPKRLLFSEDLW